MSKKAKEAVQLEPQVKTSLPKRTYVEYCTQLTKKHPFITLCICFFLFSIVLLSNYSTVAQKTRSPHPTSFPKQVMTFLIPLFQDEKSGTKAETKRSSPKTYHSSGIEVVSSPFNFQGLTGVIVAARLITGAAQGPVRAEIISENKYFPVASVLIGTSKLANGRVSAEFSTVLFPSGESNEIKAIALDGKDKAPGLRQKTTLSQFMNTAERFGIKVLGHFLERKSEAHEPAPGVVVIPKEEFERMKRGDLLPNTSGQSTNNHPVESGTPFFVVFEQNEKRK